MPSASPTQTTTSPPSSTLSKPFSISLPTYKPKQTPSQSAPRPLNVKKRPHSSLADSDSDNESSIHGPQLVSSFDHSAGGAISVDGVEKPKAPLIIVAQKNRDWREESRRKRGRNLLPAEVQAANQDASEKDVVERDVAPRDFGLSFVTAEVRDKDGDVTMVEAQITEEVSQQEAERPRTVEDEAIEALMGNRNKPSTLVIPAIRADERFDIAQNGRLNGPEGNEDDSFRSDVASRPDSASLDEYAAVPIEEFGAALLRGMGWKEGDVVGKRQNQTIIARKVERRPALLGIGAKEVPGGVGDELGAWGKVARGKRKLDKSYNPVLLRNSKTGEMLTEEELEAKKQAQKREEADWRQRRDRNLAIDEEKKSERRDRQSAIEKGSKSERRLPREHDRERDRDSSRHSSSRRARSRSADSSSRHRSSRRERSRSVERSSRHTSSSRRDSDYERDRQRGGKDHARSTRDGQRREERRYEEFDRASWRQGHHRYRDDERESPRRRRRQEEKTYGQGESGKELRHTGSSVGD